jgi:transposase-like protein
VPSRATDSRLCGEIDERVQTFLSRPIEGEWPYVWLDATYVKARRDHHIVSVAVIVAVGVNTDGRREVLGMTVGHSEAEPFWVEFLRSLARRGLHGVKLVISLIAWKTGQPSRSNRVPSITTTRAIGDRLARRAANWSPATIHRE